MDTTYRITAAPATEPITLAEAKDQCRVETDYTDDDTFLNSAIVAARQHFEAVADIKLINQTLELALTGFPRIRKIELAGSQVSSVTTIKYRDAANDQITLSASLYSLIGYIHPFFIELHSVESWPSTYKRSDSILITYQAGYANAAAVPRSIKNALLLMVSELYLNRETTTEDGKQSVLHRAYSSLLSINRTYARWS